YIKFVSSFLFSFPIPVRPPSPSIPNRKTPITAAMGVRDCFFSGRPLCLCESRGMLNIPLRVRAQSGRQTILAHCEFKMKSQVVMKLSYPHPPCPLSHSFPFALSILCFPSSKRTLTAARTSDRVTVECFFEWPRSISTLWFDRLYGALCFVHYEFYMKSLAMIIVFSL